jgi:large subunit ribosomal protein L13
MTTVTNSRTHTIDAAGKRLGIVATEAAKTLLGKDQVSYARHIMEGVVVTIENAGKMDISEKKKTEIYQSYSGHPGGRKTETLSHLATRRGYVEVLKRTIGGMLPNNKHKKQLLKQIVVTE